MIFDAIILDKTCSKPLYQQMYEQMRHAITLGIVPHGEKVPSIRAMSKALNVSRSTVELAYAQLVVEGCIVSRPQSGYYAQSGEAQTDAQNMHTLPAERESGGEEAQNVRFSFLGNYIDSRASDLEQWRKNVRAVLSEQHTAASYGDPQGEYELRHQLARYYYTVRGVNTKAENIVVGAGIQPLLSLLCGMLQDISCVGFPQSGFEKAERIFRDYRMNVEYIPSDSSGTMVPESIAQNQPVRLLYIGANMAGEKPMSIARRQHLLKWAASTDAYIIEDDYNGELRYTSRPVPTLQSIDRSGRVIYLGSFSRILMPSVRISCMVLPESLAQVYRARAGSYNQTSSKIEQLALAQYMQQGRLDRHLRRLRKLYAQKSELMLTCLGEKFGRENVTLNESALKVEVCLRRNFDAQETICVAQRRGVLINAKNSEPGRVCLVLSFAGVSSEEIPLAAEALYDALG